MDTPMNEYQISSFIRYYRSSLFFWGVCMPMFLIPSTVYHIGVRMQNWLGVKI